MNFWAELNKSFSKGNGPRKNKIKKAITNCKQNDMPVQAYYAKLKKLSEEMNNYQE